MGGCVSEEERRWQERECIGFAYGEKRKKKGAKLEIIKILVCKCYNNCVYMHGYFSSFAFLYNFTLIDVSFFFWVKMCKMDYFLYFARFSMDWCRCS